ncbi:MAG: O-antigen ligase family protein [Erythrobacter sp.]|uniref:O-antigen ligase family protein n=1 Tax=Erythrobacter sp. TaxID=1042 RepID=UPI0026258D84|nr:O-antigen ligase family protein [Erythrobacter sp.]MDJ0978421.1 O-antigen ligase family protein [Erythrobacter sp.]
MKPAGNLVAQGVWARSRAPFAAAGALLLAVFVLGGSSKDYVPGLLVIRPLAVLTLAVGLYSFTREDWQRFKLPLAFMAATLGLIALHLVPLPPALWMALPGRELAVAAGEAAGIEQPWRPITLVPYRGWNAFYATLVPAAVLVCAVQLERDQHRALALLILGGALLSAVWGAVQSVSGYAPWTFFYGLPRVEVPNGLFANRNHLAAFLVASLPLFALIASRAKGPRATIWITGCVALAAFAVMIALTTGSRAGMALTVLGLAASYLVWRSRPSHTIARRRTTKNQAWMPYAFGAFGLTTLVLFALLITQTTGFERLLSAGSGEVEEYRFIVWRTIIRFAPDYLPMGSGIGSFIEIFKVHEPDEMLGQSYWNHAHNDWLEWAMEGGIPAIALMVIAVFAWAARALALVQNSHLGRVETQLGLAGAIILFILGAWSLVDYPMRTPALASLAALCAVWMASPAAVSRFAEKAPGQAPDSEVNRGFARPDGGPEGATR